MRQTSHKKPSYPKVRYGSLTEIIPVMTPKRIARFRAKIDRSGGVDACHPWLGKTALKAGYGLLQGSDDYEGFSFLAHRVSWALANNAEPGELDVRHSCDNPPCCNPLHLLTGTDADNRRDMLERGRASHPDDPFLSRGKFGPDANAADYTHEQRQRSIMMRYQERRSCAAIAGAIGCHRATLYRWLREYEASR